MTRVLFRVSKGGHPVPLEKVLSRWHGSLNTAVLSTTVADELWLFDNSVPNREHRLVGRFLRGMPTFVSGSLPAWAGRFFAGRSGGTVQ